jgi:hypothetical protein
MLVKFYGCVKYYSKDSYFLKIMCGLLAGCNANPQFMLRYYRGGAGENERESTELPVCGRGEAAVSLYQQNGKLCTVQFQLSV